MKNVEYIILGDIRSNLLYLIDNDLCCFTQLTLIFWKSLSGGRHHVRKRRGMGGKFVSANAD